MIGEKRRTLTAEIGGLKAGMPDPDSVERALLEARERVNTATSASQTAEHRYAVANGTLTPRPENDALVLRQAQERKHRLK